LRRRIARVAGAALTALLSVCPAALGQSRSQDKKSESLSQPVNIERTTAQGEQGTLAGVVTDSADAVVAGAKVKLTSKATNEQRSVLTTDSGEFSFVGLSAAEYKLEIKGSGFKSVRLNSVNVKAAEIVRIKVSLEVDGNSVTMGLLVGVELLTTDDAAILGSDSLRKLPIK
jgi:uncharacterized surface anchored protein